MTVRAVIVAMLLMASITVASATVRIYDDPGGQIGNYLAKFSALRSSGERVEIVGAGGIGFGILRLK